MDDKKGAITELCVIAQAIEEKVNEIFMVFVMIADQIRRK